MTLSVEDFLLSIQKLILGNDLNTTYKLALVLAVTNKAGEIPFVNHPDAEVFEISYRELALEFLRIYWPQAKAYPRADNSSVKDAVLRQSFGGSNALVISLIQVFQERLCPADAQWLTFLQAQRFEKDFDRLVKDCQTRVLKKNPLQYMQGYEFLFDKDDRTNRIYVRREVAVLLCRFQPIVQELIFSRWEKMLRSIRANSGVLGETPESTLRDFLFYPHRSETLAAIRDVLRESTPAQTCFYCGRKLDSGCDVDHFLPYSRFAHTRTFNFVLACPKCNRSKSDRLAAPEHLFHWMDRNETYAEAIIECSRERLEAGAVLVSEMAAQQYDRAVNRERFWLRAVADEAPETQLLQGAEIEAVLNRLHDHARVMCRFGCP